MNDRIDPLLRISDQAQRVLAQADGVDKSAKISPLGALGLPPLLDQRRHEYQIIDTMFNAACAYDRIYVYQIPPQHIIDRDKEAADSPLAIKMSAGWRNMEQDRAHRGVIVSAGLSALDHLTAHGMGLGHIVNFAFFSILRHYPDKDQDESLVPLHAGQIISSEDTQRLLREKKIHIVRRSTENGVRHVYRLENGDEYLPEIPWAPGEY